MSSTLTARLTRPRPLAHSQRTFFAAPCSILWLILGVADLPLSLSLQWKIEPFTATDNQAGPFTEESSFAVLFPKYREQYLREAWGEVTRALDTHVSPCDTHPLVCQPCQPLRSPRELPPCLPGSELNPNPDPLTLFLLPRSRDSHARSI
jgi:hypothetical protein